MCSLETGPVAKALEFALTFFDMIEPIQDVGLKDGTVPEFFSLEW